MDLNNLGELIPIVSILAAVAFAAMGVRIYQLRIESRQADRAATLHREEKHVLEKRIAVLERIATDRGIQTADQIDALAIDKGGNA